MRLWIISSEFGIAFSSLMEVSFENATKEAGVYSPRALILSAMTSMAFEISVYCSSKSECKG